MNKSILIFEAYDGGVASCCFIFDKTPQGLKITQLREITRWKPVVTCNEYEYCGGGTPTAKKAHGITRLIVKFRVRMKCFRSRKVRRGKQLCSEYKIIPGLITP